MCAMGKRKSIAREGESGVREIITIEILNKGQVGLV